jgi:hypothetical protein
MNRIAAALIAAALIAVTGCRSAPPQTVARLDIEAAAHATPNHERADLVARLTVEIR